jgi:hypothetical protein
VRTSIVSTVIPLFSDISAEYGSVKHIPDVVVSGLPRKEAMVSLIVNKDISFMHSPRYQYRIKLNNIAYNNDYHGKSAVLDLKLWHLAHGRHSQTALDAGNEMAKGSASSLRAPGHSCIRCQTYRTHKGRPS